jgi:LCP family protein required for cell wall assembly
MKSKTEVGNKKWAWVVRALSVGFVFSSLAAGFVIYSVVRELASGSGAGFNPFGGTQGKSGELTPGAVLTPTAVQLPATPQPWDGVARVTVLVMGIDYRDWVEGKGAPRSDTMMLVTLDPITHKAGMLSIPRDLWVEIPGFGHNRINTAYMFGEANRLPGGGPELAMRTVEDVIGVPVQYFAVIDFHAFERFIDELDGINVNIQERIKISAIGRHERWLEPGPDHLDGPDALAYARVRKGAGDDFGRAERQQQVVIAVLRRIVSKELLPTLMTRAPKLYQEIATGIRTNLTLQQVVSLAWLGIQIPADEVLRGVIAPPNMVGFHTQPDGAAVLRPVPDQIRILRDEIFTDTSAFGPGSVE